MSCPLQQVVVDIRLYTESDDVTKSHYLIIIIISYVYNDILFEVNKMFCDEILCCVNFFVFAKSGPLVKI